MRWLHQLHSSNGATWERGQMAELRECVWAPRDRFVFDSHADRLLDFLRAARSGR